MKPLLYFLVNIRKQMILKLLGISQKKGNNYGIFDYWKEKVKTVYDTHESSVYPENILFTFYRDF